MSEPITLYRVDEGCCRGCTENNELSVLDGGSVVGTFVERAWCATHDLPIVNDPGECSARWDQEFDLDCESWVRLVQEPPQ